jgi:Helical and beta-bridge domain
MLLVDPHARTTCSGGDSTLLSAALKRHNLYRTETIAVRTHCLVSPNDLISHQRCHRFCAERLQSMVRTLELQRLDEYASLQKVASFATLVATYEKGEHSVGRQISRTTYYLRRLLAYTGTI